MWCENIPQIWVYFFNHLAVYNHQKITNRSAFFDFLYLHIFVTSKNVRHINKLQIIYILLTILAHGLHKSSRTQRVSIEVKKCVCRGPVPPNRESKCGGKVDLSLAKLGVKSGLSTVLSVKAKP